MARRRSHAETDGESVAGSSRTNLAGKRILIVEDETLIALEVQAMLEQQGANAVGPAGSPQAALKLIEAEKLDAALVDANLQGKPADEIAAALTRANIPFAFMSGYGRASLPQAFAKAALLAKPFAPEELISVVSNLVASRPGTIPLRD
jgi:CheY-like chemotaxis protein